MELRKGLGGLDLPGAAESYYPDRPPARTAM